MKIGGKYFDFFVSMFLRGKCPYFVEISICEVSVLMHMKNALFILL
jgi:hypothetical protein